MTNFITYKIFYQLFVDWMRRVDLSGDVAGIRMDPAIMIASGIISYPGPLIEMQDCVGGVVLKTSGEEERQGNETPVLYQVSPGVLVNAVGLPDPGYRQTVDELSDYNFSIPVIASVSGKNPEGIAKVVELFSPYVRGFEANFSCPNIAPGEEIGVTIGYDRSRVKDYIEAMRESTIKPIFIKPPPALYVYNKNDFMDTIGVGLDGGANGVTLINTMPGGMAIDIHAKKPILSAGFGGVSGRGIKPIGVGAVYSVRQEFPRKDYPDMGIMGVGGIQDPEDVIEYIMADADAVQIGTALYGKNTKQKKQYLKNLALGVRSLLEEGRYDSLDDIRGAAHG
jgi:dihydroorotate dehydrogenase (NAD+) catalytic subunit